MEEDKNDQTVTETEVETTEEGTAAVEESKTEESVKDVLGKQLGKEFSSDDEALAAVDGLKKLVGDQKVAEDRKKAKELEEMKKDPNYSKLRAELEEIKLTQRHPEAGDYVDEIRAIADAKGISYNEAYENSSFGKLVAAKGQEKEERKEKIAALPGTDKKVSSATDDEWAAAAKAAEEGDMSQLMKLKMPQFFGEQN